MYVGHACMDTRTTSGALTAAEDATASATSRARTAAPSAAGMGAMIDALGALKVKLTDMLNTNTGTQIFSRFNKKLLFSLNHEPRSYSEKARK